jgi:hypothetical protein
MGIIFCCSALRPEDVVLRGRGEEQGGAAAAQSAVVAGLVAGRHRHRAHLLRRLPKHFNLVRIMQSRYASIHDLIVLFVFVQAPAEVLGRLRRLLAGALGQTARPLWRG